MYVVYVVYVSLRCNCIYVVQWINFSWTWEYNTLLCTSLLERTRLFERAFDHHYVAFNRWKMNKGLGLGLGLALGLVSVSFLDQSQNQSQNAQNTFWLRYEAQF